MKSLLALLVALICGCAAATPVTQYPLMSQQQQVEQKPLPERPDAKEIPEKEDWVKPLNAGECTATEGVLLSAAKAARAKKWQLGYNALRDLYDTDRQIWSLHRITYEERIGQANITIKRISPSWWDENRTIIGWTGGFIMGAVSSIAIVYGLDQVRQ